MIHQPSTAAAAALTTLKKTYISREQWVNILPGTMHEQIWKDDEEESEVSSEAAARDEDDDYYDSEEGNDESDEGEADELSGHDEKECPNHDNDTDTKKFSSNNNERIVVKSKKKSAREEMNDLNDRLNLNDPNSTPQRSELMNQFFSRTAKYWMALDIESNEMEKVTGITRGRGGGGGGGGEFSEKEVRRRAFKLAEARYTELQPMLRRLDRLEKQQRELEEAKGVNNRDIDSQRRRRIKDGGGRKNYGIK